VLAPFHSLSHNKRTRHDVYVHLQMNAPFIYVRRPSAQSGAALRCASAMPAAKKKRAGPAGRGEVRRAGGEVRRAGGGSGGPPPPSAAAVTERLRNSRSVRHEPVRFSKKRKKHPFVKIIEKTPFRYTDIQWPHDQRDQAGGKTWEGKLAVCGRKPLYALARSGTQYHLVCTCTY
jgi:hypothetical protein